MMTSENHDTTSPSPLSRALATIRHLKGKLATASAHCPIAVIGAGLRFPGGIDDLDAYWKALCAGRDLVRPLPAARKGPFAREWESLPQRGGFLDEVMGFDAAFFGISPREARALDPQHRLLLEVAWEALEHAALPPARMKGQRAGLYVGLSGIQEYWDWLGGPPDAYWATGSGHCFAAGRLAYTIGLTGPALSVDTACSSSLVAVHLACQGLRRGECDVALAGGVNLILSPRSTRLLKETRSLAPDGLCKSFDARANGFTRGEGCGLVVLKRLDHAVRDEDRILAVIHGSAINQDGRSSGFMAPNVRAQIAVIEAALADAGLTANDIGLVEAHGTGTALGDPIEVEALVAALGRGSIGGFHVGSVKTNFGHLEAAAGIAGVIKAALCVARGAVSPLVHFKTLNPRIDLDGAAITFPTALVPWRSSTEPRYAGVSSFGMSGTNAHIIIGAPPDRHDSTSPEVDGFELAARTPEALRRLATSFAEALADLTPDNYPDFAYTATVGRARHACRARITAGDQETALSALSAVARDKPSPHVEILDRATPDNTVFETLPRRIIDLPRYPWERQLYIPEPAQARIPEAALGVPPQLLELAWEKLPTSETVFDGLFVIAGDDSETLELLAGAMRINGSRYLQLCPSTSHHRTSDGPLPGDDAAWDAVWRQLSTETNAVLVLAMRSPSLPEQIDSERDIAAEGAAMCVAVCTAVRSLQRSSRGQPRRRAYVVTRGGRRITGREPAILAYQGLLQGLAPVLGLEFRAAFGGVIDLSAAPEPEDAATLLRLIRDCRVEEDLLAVRAGEALGGRLRPAPTRYTPELTVCGDATYVVTGGIGGVGRAVVDELFRRGACHFLLIGRRVESQLVDAELAWLGALRLRSVHVVYRSVNVDDGVALAEACRVLSTMPRVGGVVHGAGNLAPTPLAQADTANFLDALRGKFSGAWWLHLLARGWSPDFFIQLSSVSALWGTSGYGAYAAANGGMEAVAAYRGVTGDGALSIAYGPWALGGMVDATALRELSRNGFGALTAESGCASLANRGPDDGTLLVACLVDWQRFGEVMSRHRRRALFDIIAPDAAQPESAVRALPGAALLALPERARGSAAREMVGRHVARLLGYADPSSLPEDVGFFELGLDSIMAADLTRELSEAFGVALQTTHVFDHPTVTDLAEFVLGRVDPDKTVSTDKPASAPRPPAVDRSAALDAHASPAPANGAVAIVGMAGRFPGADSPEELWRMLRDGHDAVGPVPLDRWDAAALHDLDPLKLGTISSQEGGFLKDLPRFDATFFRISSREAESLDPQQRLLLEIAWHALEDANVDPKRLRGTRTGVFVGISNSDYGRLLEQGGLEQIDAYFGTGTALNAAAGRLAYVLGLNGPALAVDTACSSSLVALHLAIRSLRQGETDCALVGGVNVIAAPLCSVAVSRAHMLSPDGRCKAFSAQADGFVRSEGCGVLVLKRLEEAQRAGDRVLAVIHGSAVNQDGASSGLTVPSGPAQETLIRAALADARLDAAAVSYLEAHGTGTALGDPIEVNAAWSAYGQERRREQPLWIGSVKSNVGHCESAAGIVGVIKVVLALQAGQLPPSLHCKQLNPEIPWHAMNIRIVNALTPWSVVSGPRIAGVSSFGFTGTNAHVIIGAAQEVGDAPPACGPFLLPLSAPDAAGLARLVGAWSQPLAQARPSDVSRLAVAASVGRAHHMTRIVVLGETGGELLAALQAQRPAAGSRPPRIGFVFSGQGSQYFGMGRELYETEPVFREVIDACGDALDESQLPLKTLLFSVSDRELIHQTCVAQPALVALELALAALWESWGVTASAVMGHSVGEITAAIHAGVMDIRSGLKLISHRARLMQRTKMGAMLAVMAPLAKTLGLIAGTSLDVAAINGPESIVISGDPEAIDAAVARMKAEGVTTRKLAVTRAFHSRLMDPILDDFHDAIAPLTFRPPRFPIVSNLTGCLAAPGEHDAAYWCSHVRQPVRFHEGARTLAEADIDFFLEIGPDRTLLNILTSVGIAPPGAAVASLRRGTRNRDSMLGAAKALYERGQDLRWAAVQAATGARAGQAPLYPFAATRHWIRGAPKPTSQRSAGSSQPHWGEELRSPALQGRVFAFERSVTFPPYLRDHRLYATVVTPAASHLATAFSALCADGSPLVIENMICPRALVIKEDERFTVQLIVSRDGKGESLSVQSLIDPERGVWHEHLSARIGSARPAPAMTLDRSLFIASADWHATGEEFYSYCHKLGYSLGSSFRWVGDVWVRDDQALVRFEQPALPDDPSDYELYPGLIDSCFQSIAAFLIDGEASEAPALAIPFAAERVNFQGPPAPGSDLWGHVRVNAAEVLPGGRSRVEQADIELFTGTGATILAIDGFRVRYAPRELLEQSLRSAPQRAYEPVWIPFELEHEDERSAEGRRIQMTGPDSELKAEIACALAEHGHRAYSGPVEAPGDAALDAIVDVSFCGLADESGPDATLRAVLALAVVLQRARPSLPYIVLADGGSAAAPVREALWGMLAALEAEQPERQLVRVTLSPGWCAGYLSKTITWMLNQGLPERQLAISDTVKVARLRPVSATVHIPRWDGSVLISGGLGALGLSVARMLVQQGAREIVLMSRSEPTAAAKQVIEQLTARGVRLAILAADVCCRDDCERAVAAAVGMAPLRAVFHLAGHNDDRAFSEMPPESFRRVFAAKAHGAANLVAAVRGQPITSFVLFSSVSSVLGSAGQVNYAAANGHLDGLAVAWRDLGIPATSINWGPWIPATGGGMADRSVVIGIAEKSGVRPLRDGDAEALLSLATSSARPRLVALDIDFIRYSLELGGHPRSALVSEQVAVTRGDEGRKRGAQRPAGWLRESLYGLDREELTTALKSAVRGLVHDVLNEPVPEDDGLGFFEMGLDSIMLIDLRTLLAHSLNQELSSVVAIDYPNISAMARYLANTLTFTISPGQAAQPAGVASPQSSEEAPRAELGARSLEQLLTAVRQDLAAEV